MRKVAMTGFATRMLSALGSFVALGWIATGAAHAEGPIGTSGGPNVSVDGCWYYEHADFKGRRGEIPRGAALPSMGDAWNDRISSVACSAGCRLRAWQQRNFAGAAEDFYPNTVYVGEAWDEAISSIEVVCNW